jgi:RimJ/RimL family protein N-acetyltransferase
MVAWLRQQGAGRVVAHVHPQHEASAAVARAVGLTPSGRVVDGEVRWES